MTRDEIIKLASQAIDDTRSEVDLPVPFVLRFANLVIADFLAQTGQYVTNDASREAAIKKAVDAEREACAKVCEERAEAWQAAHLAGQRAMQERAAKLLGDAAENCRKSPMPHYGIPIVFDKAKEEVLALEVKL